MTCNVCGAKESEYHFGGMCCRACAAFFRRCAHSKKVFIVCTCKKRMENSHPCRYCRMGRCLDIGMELDRVQVPRDKIDASKAVITPSESPPDFSLLNCRIIPRETPNVSSTLSKWGSFEDRRAELGNSKITTLNVYEATCYTKSDCFCITQLFQAVFSTMRELSERDQTTLASNVLQKWVLMECAIDYAANRDKWERIKRNGEFDKMIVSFYGSAMPEETRMKDSDLLQLFAPYWYSYYNVTHVAIADRKFDHFEYSALFLLLMFDYAYTNISEDCRKMCENVRKVILRELKGYQTDKNYEETRLLETVEILSVLEKAEKKFEEEVLICEMHNISLHEDFLQISKTCKY
ncbi:unnamed protein product [Caenorhabditis sp. 36 PRJEB53466]|nr:unnamed protein product [Caenorhabditis sp. 36 PRJEB53466]